MIIPHSAQLHLFFFQKITLFKLTHIWILSKVKNPDLSFMISKSPKKMRDIQIVISARKPFFFWVLFGRRENGKMESFDDFGADLGLEFGTEKDLFR